MLPLVTCSVVKDRLRRPGLYAPPTAGRPGTMEEGTPSAGGATSARAGRPRRRVAWSGWWRWPWSPTAAWSSGAATSPAPSARPSWRPPEMGLAGQVEVWAAAGRLRRLLGDDLLAAWLVGSGALGGVSAQSDVDVVGCLRHRPAGRAPPGRRRRPGRAGRDPAAAGPGPGVHPRAAVAIPARRPRFAVNLNAGPRMPFHVSFDPVDEPAHRFVLDLAILRAHGRTLTGPPPAELVGPIPCRWQLMAVRTLAWHQANEPALQQSVLNACRGWRYAEEDVWCSAGGRRRLGPSARRRPRHRLPPPWPRRDLAHSLDPARVRAFLHHVLEAVERAPG